MKISSTIAVASLALRAVATSPAREHVERQPILGGGEVPIGTKTYTAGIHTTPDGITYCGGTHYINGTKDGEQIKVVSAQNHTLNNVTIMSYDFALLTLEKPSKFTPIHLPKTDDSDIIAGMWTKVMMGWGDTSFPNGTRSNELQSVGLEIWNNKDCLPGFYVDNSSVCAGGAGGRDSCVGDTAGSLIKEKGQGDAGDILVGLVS
ncbi:Peptidase S1, PA clan [Phytophthora cactorum]|nr:Peptidase S1, PA clan [Phytophthora cactorum]KAG3006125.1 hypothetical protein PC120_g17564 [Phytophthora cactorum]KAG3049923.1 hypothetical protein PC121_g18676 [Phytophthora cactorum]KAG4046272.1 hypothetical protein PC123_g18339 [Phytophthora cactorum]